MFATASESSDTIQVDVPEKIRASTNTAGGKASRILKQILKHAPEISAILATIWAFRGGDFQGSGRWQYLGCTMDRRGLL